MMKHIEEKISVQLVQLNNKYGSQVYLPYSAGILQSFAEKSREISSNYSFKDFVFIREKLSKMVSQIGNVDVLGVSCYVWNWSLSLELAKMVRKNNPDCLIIFGGPQVPGKIDGFFEEYGFIDIAVIGEGEATFAEILKAYTDKNKNDLKGIGGSHYYDRKENKLFTGLPRERIVNLETIPSPYLTGVFDKLFEDSDYSWMVTWETNRGCPFKCSFCDWGSAIATKVRKFSEDRLMKEIDYFTEKKVDLVFGADANYGIFKKRDKAFSLRLAENKKKKGYPNQFRVCFTKNSTDTVFELAKIFADAGMNKGVSISMQSLNVDTLTKIQRRNIKMLFFKDLQKKYVEAGLVTYTELILPLPGESYESFVEGIDSLLDSSQHSGIVIYNCSIMPNAEMGGEAYQKTHMLDMVEIPIFQAHSDVTESDEVEEKETIVVGTSTMSREKYRETFKYAWIIQSMHLLGLLQSVSISLRLHAGIKYSDFYRTILEYGKNNPESIIGKELKLVDEVLDSVMSGKSFGQTVKGFEKIVWPPEEATFLRISNKLDSFYKEANRILLPLVGKENKELLKDLIKYQKLRVVTFKNQNEKIENFEYNVHQFFEDSRAGMVSILENTPCQLKTKPEKNYDNKKIFSREVVWYGRKGGKFFHPIEEVVKQ